MLKWLILRFSMAINPESQNRVEAQKREGGHMRTEQLLREGLLLRLDAVALDILLYFISTSHKMPNSF